MEKEIKRKTKNWTEKEETVSARCVFVCIRSGCAGYLTMRFLLLVLTLAGLVMMLPNSRSY